MRNNGFPIYAFPEFHQVTKRCSSRSKVLHKWISDSWQSAEKHKALRLGTGRLQKAIYQSRGCHPHLLPNTEHKGKAIKIFPVIEFWSKCRKCSLAHEWTYIHPISTHRAQWGTLLAMCSASLLPLTMLSLETAQIIEKTSFCGFCPPRHMQGIKMTSAAMWRMELIAVSQHNDSQGREACVRDMHPTAPKWKRRPRRHNRDSSTTSKLKDPREEDSHR